MLLTLLSADFAVSGVLTNWLETTFTLPSQHRLRKTYVHKFDNKLHVSEDCFSVTPHCLSHLLKCVISEHFVLFLARTVLSE